MLQRALFSHYLRHPVQGLFLLTGVIVANVLLVGTLLINAQARASYDQGETLLRASPVGQVRHRDPGRAFDERNWVELRRQGFDGLAPVLRRVVRTAGGEPLELLGIDPFALPRSAGVAGGGADFGGFAFPPYQLWAAPARIRQLGAVPGERLALASGAALPPLVAAGGEDLGHRLLIDIGALQELTASRGELTAMLVFGDEPGRLAALREALPPELDYFAYEEAPDPAELTRSFHLNLAAMGLLAFVVGVFLVYNALAFSYTDRGELIRKLRLSGVAPSELRRALLLELAGFLLLGGLLGGLLGAVLAAWLLPGVGRTLAQLYGVYIGYPDLLVPAGVTLPLLMTAVAAGLCVLFPLRETLRAPLLERRQAGWQVAAARQRDWLLMAAGVTMLLAAALTGRQATTLWTALAGLALLLVGAVLCLPAVLRALLATAERLLPRRWPRAAWLVADSRWLLGPAALALMALTLALVANSGLNTMISSFRLATDEWLGQRLAAQVYLRGDLDLPGLGGWLAQRDPRLHAVARYRTEFDRPTAGGAARVELVTLQPGERFLRSVGLIEGLPDAEGRFAAGAGVFVSERAWRLDGWDPGDRVTLCPEQPQQPVLGVYHDYGNPLSQWMVAEDLFRACWPDRGPASRAVYGPPELDWPALETALRARYALEADQLIDQAGLKAAGLAVFDRTFTVTRALNALTLLVAGIGIFCAVSAIHHHRVGQQALLASLGLSRRERGALLLLQWGLLGLLCMVLAWPFGTLLAGYLAGVVTPIAFGWSFPLRPEWQHLGALLLTAATCLLLAVALPSLRLLRTSPAAMLREQAT